MGLLDYLFDPGTYGGSGGLLSQIQPNFTQLPDSQGFPQQGMSFADRFQPAIDQPLTSPQPSPTFAQRFQPASDNPLVQMAGNINVGGYSMPRIGNPSDYASQPSMNAQAAIPPNAQPTQGQLLPDQIAPLPPALGGVNMGGNFGAGLQSLVNTPGGLLPKLLGGATGLLTGQRSDPAGMQQQNLKAQYDALVPVVGPQKALLAVMNPEAGKTILQEALTDKQDIKMVKDEFGAEHPYWYDKVAHTFVPAMPQGAGGAQPGSMQETISNLNGMGPNVPMEQRLAQVPEAYRGYVKSLLDGKALPTNVGRSQLRGPLMTLAHAVDPNFDEANIPLRFKTAGDYAPNGKSGASIVALNTVQHHIGQLSDALENKDLGDTGWTFLNRLRNGIAQNTPLDKTQGAAIKRVQDAMTAVEDEMANAYKAGRVSDSEIKRWHELTNTNLPLPQLKQGLADFVGLLNGKRDQLNETHQAILGRDAPGINRDLNEAITKRVTERNSGTASSSAAPAVSEGATATNPQTGAKIVFKGGKWVPAQ